MRTDWLFRREMEHLLAALTPANRLALDVSMATGLRLGDVLNLKREQLAQRFTVREQKTGKTRRVFLSNELLKRALALAGKVYVFEGRTSDKKHRTRQAVFKDLKRVARIFRLKVNVAPHTARKIYAVEAYHKTGDLKRVQRLLNHSGETVTALYAMADELVSRHHKKKTPTKK